MTTQGARKTSKAPESAVIDLDALVYKSATKPVPIRLGGVDYTLRRDLTSEEVMQFWSYTGKGKDVAAMAILLGEDPEADEPEQAKRLTGMLLSLPQPVWTKAYRQILTAAGLNLDGDEGESSAS